MLPFAFPRNSVPSGRAKTRLFAFFPRFLLRLFVALVPKMSVTFFPTQFAFRPVEALKAFRCRDPTVSVLPSRAILTIPCVIRMECTSRSSVVAFPPLLHFFWLRNLRKKRHLQTEPFAPEAEPVCAHRYANEQNLLVQNEARYVSGMNLFQSFAGGPHFLGGKAFQPRPANTHTHTRTYLV